MSKHKVDITEKVMGKINAGEVSMRPKTYFIAGSILLFFGLVGSTVAALFFINISGFLIQSHGPMGQYRYEQIVSNFPLWVPFLAILSIILGIFLLRKYDFSYRKNFTYVVLAFLTAILISSWVIETSGIDKLWFQHGPMRRMMQRYVDEDQYDRQFDQMRRQKNRKNFRQFSN